MSDYVIVKREDLKDLQTFLHSVAKDIPMMFRAGDVARWHNIIFAAPSPTTRDKLALLSTEDLRTMRWFIDPDIDEKQERPESVVLSDLVQSILAERETNG